MPIPQQKGVFQRQNAKQRVLETLYGWLVDGTLQPGERIYDEELSSYFDVSRTPVREALQELARVQLVEILPAKCTRVAPITRQELEQSYPLFAQLQCMAVRLAFPKVNAEALARMERQNRQLQLVSAGGNLREVQKADLLFHEELIALAGNKYLTDFIHELAVHIYRAEIYFFSDSGCRKQSTSGHDKILAALRERNLEAAVAAMEENWMLNFYRMIEVM